MTNHQELSTPDQDDRAAGLRTETRRRWYFPAAVAVLLVASFFRLWQLGTIPPGMHGEELVNAQISQQILHGNLSVIYDQVQPAREGLYYVLLALSTAITGHGLILWRLPSVWLSMLAIAMTLRLMRHLFGARVSLMTGALMAVAFWPVWMGRTVQHVTLMPLITTVVIYTLTRAYFASDQTESSLWFTLCGIALGVAQYVHVTAWTLLVIVFAFLAYRLVTNHEELMRHRANIVYAGALVAVVCLPLIVFIVRHPGVREPVPVASQPGLILEMPGRLIVSLSALVLRGDMLPWHNLPGRPIFGPFLGVLLVIGIGVALARWRRPAYGLALLWMAVGLLPVAFLPHQPDFEYMAVTLPVVFVFPAIGLLAIFQFVRDALPQKISLRATEVVSGVVVILVVGNTVWTYRDYFIVWPSKGDVRLTYEADLGLLAHYLDTSRDPSPVSICSTPVDRSEDPFALTNAELLGYLMHRHDLPIRYFDCTQSLIIANGGESQLLIFPRGHYYDHLPGALLVWMRYAHDEGVPGIRPDVIMRLDVSQQIADRAGAFQTTALTAWPPEANDPNLAALPVTFGYNVSFLGYEVRGDTIHPTDWVELTTYWRMDGPPPPKLTLFAHLLSNPVVVIAQTDSLGVDIGTLQVRDIFLQHSMIQTREGMTPGAYALSVGLYFPDTGQRLPAFVNGSVKADRLFLKTITVLP